MSSIELTESQRAQMTGLIGQLNTTRTVAEAFVGYFAKELGVNLQLYQFNADTLTFEPVQGFMPPMPAAQDSSEQGQELMPEEAQVAGASKTSRNGKVEAI